MCNGKIIKKNYDADGLGNYIIIKSNEGLGFLYAHMREASPLNIGDNVEIGQYVGHEGTTGNSTGIHLHLEMQNLNNGEWEFNADISKYLNPCEFMGIPNENGISIFYNGQPIFIKKKNKWLYSRNKKFLIYT